MTSSTTSALPLPGAVLAPAAAADAAEILVLQRCCWVAEAIENDRLDVPALLSDGTPVPGAVMMDKPAP